MGTRTAVGRNRSRLRHVTSAAILGVALHLPAGPAKAAEAEVAPHLPESAVVFTGVPNRVLWGLRLLEDGKIRRLLVSGISEDEFTRDVRLSRALATAREEGRLVLGTRAQSTLENAAETACWLRREGLAGPILLITSEFHLPRATEALAQAAPGIAIEPLGVADPTDPSHVGREETEARKLAVTRALGLLPSRLGMREGFADCTGVEFR